MYRKLPVPVPPVKKNRNARLGALLAAAGTLKLSTVRTLITSAAVPKVVHVPPPLMLDLNRYVSETTPVV